MTSILLITTVICVVICFGGAIDEHDSGNTFLNFVTLILGGFLYYIAKAYGISIAEFFTKDGFFSKLFFGISSYVIPPIVGISVSSITQKIYNYKSKIRMALLFFSMLTLVIFQFFIDYYLENDIDYILTVLKPNISFIVGGLLAVVFHPVEND